MKKYKAISNRRNFRLTEDNNLLGELVYIKWSSLNAAIKLIDNNENKFKTKGIWNQKIELFQNDKKLLELKMGWKGIKIQTQFENHITNYLLKNISFFSNKFTLVDSDKTELVQINSDFQWKKLRYDYDLTTTAEFDKLENDKMLLFAIIYGINYRNTSMAAAGGAT
jgi:hypothetical protein